MSFLVLLLVYTLAKEKPSSTYPRKHNSSTCSSLEPGTWQLLKVESEAVRYGNGQFKVKAETGRCVFDLVSSWYVWDGELASGDRGFWAVVQVDKVRRHSKKAGELILLAKRAYLSPSIKNLFPRRLSSLLDSELAPAGGLAFSLLTGQREVLDEYLWESFKNVGLTHLLVPSGLHLAMAYGMALLVAGFLFYPHYLRKPLVWKARKVSGLLLATLYGLLLGMPPTVVRALFSLSIFTIAKVAYLRFKALSCIVLYALLVLIWDRELLFSPGTQLTISALLGLYLASRFSKVYEVKSKILSTVIYCSGAWLLTSIVQVYWFGEIAPAGVLSNVIFVPMFGLSVLMPSIMLGVLICLDIHTEISFLVFGAIGAYVYLVSNYSTLLSTVGLDLISLGEGEKAVVCGVLCIVVLGISYCCVVRGRSIIDKIN